MTENLPVTDLDDLLARLVRTDELLRTVGADARWRALLAFDREEVARSELRAAGVALRTTLELYPLNWADLGSGIAALIEQDGVSPLVEDAVWRRRDRQLAALSKDRPWHTTEEQGIFTLRIGYALHDALQVTDDPQGSYRAKIANNCLRNACWLMAHGEQVADVDLLRRLFVDIVDELLPGLLRRHERGGS